MLVKVGAEAKEYHIQEPLLVQHSEFFRTALGNPIFASAQDRVVDLRDIEPGKKFARRFKLNAILHTVNTETFDVFVYWLDRESLPEGSSWYRIFLGQHKPANATDEAEFWEHWKASCRTVIYAYVLADRLIAPDFKSTCLEHACYRLGSVSLSCEAISYAFDNLPEKSAFLELIVDKYCNQVFARHRERKEGDPDHSRDAFAELPVDFLYRVTCKYEKFLDELLVQSAVQHPNYYARLERGS